jgi:hypothetical protein
MENEILKRQLLLMKYDMSTTLTENLENVGDVISEQGVIRDVVAAGKVTARELEGVLKIMTKDSKVAKELKNVALTDAKGVKTGVRTAEELASAIKLNKLSSNLRGELELAILRSRTTNKSLIDAAASNLVRNKQFLSKYSQELAQGQVAYEKALKQAGYSEEAITSIVKQTENIGGKIKSGEDIVKSGKESKIKPAKIKGEESLLAAKEEALAKESWMMRQKDRMSKLYNGGKGKIDKALKNKWIQKGFLKTTGKISKRKLLAWAATIGISYFVLKNWLGSQGIEEDTSGTLGTSDSGREGTGGLRTTDGSFVSKYKACSGTYKINCKSDVISKIQGCLGLKPDGKFGPKTETAVQAKLGKTEFTDADVNTLCSEVVTTTTTQPKPQEDLSLPKLQTKKISDLEPIQSNLPKELQTKTVRYSREPIFGATTLEGACGNDRLNDKFRACKRKFGRIMKISNVEMNESVKPLELIIHEALLKKSNTKKKINENFRNFKNILTETNDDIIEDFINEVYFLREIGIDDNIIEEGLGDMFGSLLGNSGSGIMQYFKVKFANWVLEKLKIADPNSWIGEIISQLFAQLPIKDYGRFVSDCDFATDKISQALADSAAAHFAKQKGWDNPITGVLMQSASESLFGTQFIDSLQENLANVICPLFGQVSAKVKKVVSGASA